MRNYFVMGAAFCVALAMVSCKSSESAYKKAYDKAKQPADLFRPHDVLCFHAHPRFFGSSLIPLSRFQRLH